MLQKYCSQLPLVMHTSSFILFFVAFLCLFALPSEVGVQATALRILIV